MITAGSRELFAVRTAGPGRNLFQTFRDSAPRLFAQATEVGTRGPGKSELVVHNPSSRLRSFQETHSPRAI